MQGLIHYISVNVFLPYIFRFSSKAVRGLGGMPYGIMLAPGSWAWRTGMWPAQFPACVSPEPLSAGSGPESLSQRAVPELPKSHDVFFFKKKKKKKKERKKEKIVCSNSPLKEPI
jgi:hypothetical protein